MTYLLDTDTFTLAYSGHAAVRARIARVSPPDRVAVPAVTRVEVVRGRFEAILKAADGPAVLRAIDRLRASEEYLAKFPMIPFDGAAAGEFDTLLAVKAVK